VPTPNRNPTEMDNSLRDIAVVSADDAWAIGQAQVREEGGRGRSVILRWDGSRWRAVRHAQDGIGLEAIAASSASDAWAVGGASILRWDGTEWRRSRPADPGTRFWHFDDVTALASDDAWAVGAQVGRGVSSTLIEHWDGARWSIVPSPEPPVASPAALSAGLTAVAGSSSDDVWAVGTWNFGCPSTYCSGGVVHTLAEHWDGERWRIVPMPDAPDAMRTDNELLAVSVAGLDDAWAVGLVSKGGLGGRSDRQLIERWDGSSWRVVPGPSFGGRASVSGVTAVSPSAAWAVGSAGTESVIERWDGSSWSVDPTPDVGGSWLAGVAAGPDGDLWAVGQRGGDLPQARTLAMRCS